MEWERLFRHAVELIDSVTAAGTMVENWSFGGGTVLMRRHHHRLSKDIDIFLEDPQYLGYLTPRLNSNAEALTQHYDEQRAFLKLYLPEGEIDFVVAGPLTPEPTEVELIFGRDVLVETSTEIIAKKIWYRGAEFTARDIFDLAMVAEMEPAALPSIRPVLRDRRAAILHRISTHEETLRETFAALEVLEYQRSYDEAVEIVKTALGNS
jgi:hypothetical protein